MRAGVSRGQGRGGLGGARRFIVLGVVLGGEVVDTIEGPGGVGLQRRLKGIVLRGLTEWNHIQQAD